MNSQDCIRAIELHGKAGNTLCIAGPSGIGKTSITEQYAQMQRASGPFFYGVFNGATANLADTIGFLLPKDVEYIDTAGHKHVVPHGKYTYPHYFMDRDTLQPAFMFERGLLVIEEYGQASPDVKRALATLLHERRVGDALLPAGFQVVCLTNRASDRSGVGKDFDFIINRRVDIEFTPELEPWLVWAAENNVEPVVMAFAARNAEVVFSGKHPEKQGPWCTPRSLVAAGNTIKAAKGHDIDFEDDTSFMMQNLKGSLGQTAVQLMAFLKLRHNLPSLDAILANPAAAMVPDTPDSQMIITHELSHRANKENIQAVVAYMQRLPKAFGVTFMQVILRKSPMLVGTAAVGDWARENSQLLAVISKK